MTVPLPPVRRVFSILPILALLLASLLPGNLAAQQEEPAPDAVAVAERECRALAAKSLRKAADAAWSANLRFTAAGHYRHLLELDPEEPIARGRLGFRKGAGGWTAAEEPVLKDRAGARLPWGLESLLAKEFEEVAAAFARLGLALRHAGREDGALDAFRKALRFDRRNVAANEGLGNRKIGGYWRTPTQASHMEFRAMVDAAVKGAREEPIPVVAEAGRTVEEDRLGWTFRRARGPRYQVAADPVIDEEVALCRDAEVADEFLGRVFGRDDGRRRGVIRSFLVVKDKEDFRHAVFALEKGSPAKLEWWARLAGLSLTDGVYMLRGLDYSSRRDCVAHKAGESFLSRRFGGTAMSRPWLAEAFGTLASGETAGTTTRWCVNRSTSAVQRASFDDYRFWRPSLASFVEAGEDRALAAIFASDLNSLEKSDVAKAGSVLLWLLETRRERLLRFLDLLDTDGKEGELAEKAFGEEPAVLDGRWRKWILEVR